MEQKGDKNYITATANDFETIKSIVGATDLKYTSISDKVSKRNFATM